MLFFSLLLCTTPGWADTDTSQKATAYPPVAAHYREARTVAGKPEGSADWYFVRQDRQIETARAGYAEVWRRDERGEIMWRRVFHEDRKLVEYTTGQLRTENRLPAWNTLNTVIDSKRLAELKTTGHAPAFSRPATHYRGTLGDESVEVVWLSREVIPARIVRKGKDVTYTLTLLELHDAPQPSWPQANPAQTDSYELIDGADLGDREYDPFVARLLQVDARHDPHGGHRH
jgi:hypothetical protein